MNGQLGGVASMNGDALGSNVDLLNLAQTITAIKTFAAGIKLNETKSTTVVAASDSVGAKTITIPDTGGVSMNVLLSALNQVISGQQTFVAANLVHTQVATGVPTRLQNIHTGVNNDGSHSQLELTTTASGGDPKAIYTAGTDIYSTGIDNTDSGAYVESIGEVLGTGNVRHTDTDGQTTWPKQGLVFAYKSTDSTNETGKDATVTVVFDEIVTQQGAADYYDETKGEFEAPKSGVYLVVATIQLKALGASHTAMFLKLKINSDDRYQITLNPTAIKQGTELLVPPLVRMLFLQAGDVVSVQVLVTGAGTNDLTIGGNSDQSTFFGVILIA